MERDLSRENVMIMQDMIETTDSNVFRESCDDLSELTEVVSSYIDFVSDVCIPQSDWHPLI